AVAGRRGGGELPGRPAGGGDGVPPALRPRAHRRAGRQRLAARGPGPGARDPGRPLEGGRATVGPGGAHARGGARRRGPGGVVGGGRAFAHLPPAARRGRRGARAPAHCHRLHGGRGAVRRGRAPRGYVPDGRRRPGAVRDAGHGGARRSVRAVRRGARRVPDGESRRDDRGPHAHRGAPAHGESRARRADHARRAAARAPHDTHRRPAPRPRRRPRGGARARRAAAAALGAAHGV
ncbi:MAG: hypothetical protein AVDCRST_MAG40-2286, partial [uncultured Gemmatimonadaceae bacterium]